MSGGGDTELPDRTPIYVDSLPLRMCNVELHSLNRLCVVTSFQRVQYWTWEREGRVSLQWRSLRWWRSTSTVIKSSWSVSIPTQRDENGVLPPWPSCVPEAHNPNIILRKSSDKFQLRDILQNVWQVFLKTVKVIKNREDHNQKESKRHDE